MSFHLQKKLLGLQIFNQGRFLLLGGGGGRGGGTGMQSDLENCAYLWKNPAYAPWNYFGCGSFGSIIHFWIKNRDLDFSKKKNRTHLQSTPLIDRVVISVFPRGQTKLSIAVAYRRI